jgi:hypothetical protein
MKLKIVFAKLTLVVRGAGTQVGGLEAVSLVAEALREARERPLSKTSPTLRWFMPSDRGFLFDDAHLVGYYAYGHGETYRAVDRETQTIEDVVFPKLPFKGRVLFVLDDAGFLIIRSTTDQYIDPESVMDAIREEVRIKYDYWYDVRADLLPLIDQFQTIRAFLDSLTVLREFRISSLRKSNPEPTQYAEWVDELAKAEVDTIVEQSHKKQGIDRDSVTVRAQLEHVRNYGKLQDVAGAIDGSETRMTITESRTELTVAIESREESAQVEGALKALEKIRQKLREL